MKQTEVGRWIYSILVLLAVFAVGFFLGRDREPHSLQMTTVTEEAQTASVAADPSQEAPEEVIFPLDLNTATAMEFQQLPGIGEELAKRIVAYRNTWGRFLCKEQIMDVKGIGETKYAAMEQLITVEDENEDSGGG